jgi:hypothetical protein
MVILQLERRIKVVDQVVVLKERRPTLRYVVQLNNHPMRSTVPQHHTVSVTLVVLGVVMLVVVVVVLVVLAIMVGTVVVVVVVMVCTKLRMVKPHTIFPICSELHMVKLYRTRHGSLVVVQVEMIMVLLSRPRVETVEVVIMSLDMYG